MNIKEARQEIINTVRAYLKKDETGAYVIPYEKQRPILLMGPPGIGKTAILSQAASACGINLIAYTITHHTRQSAIGLPFISTHAYDGKETSVTEYTMSEIIAAVYEQIERTGIREGILFLDEINCVSETLAPTMLQFLQYKTFGAHRLPEGFLIVTAGNPPEYNKSVRDFDVVTLDRVKRIDITADYPAWKEYAYRAGIHGAILSYLEIRKEHFYKIRIDVAGKHFVTARGWEDLSRIIWVYESEGLPVTENLVRQYLQDEEVASSFATYYDLWQKYRSIYDVPEIMEGRFPSDVRAMKEAPFDEKLSMIGLLTDRLNGEFRTYSTELEAQKILFGELQKLKESMAGSEADSSLAALWNAQVGRMKTAYQNRKAAHLFSEEEDAAYRHALHGMETLAKELTERTVLTEAPAFSFVRDWFAGREAARQEQITESGKHLTNSFAFLAETYGESQEMVLFLSELAAGYYSLKYVSECGNEAYDRYQRLLLPKDRRARMQQELQSFLQI